MATNILDVANYVQGQGELGRQRRNNMLLGGYASQVQSGTPDQQNFAIAEAAKIDPTQARQLRSDADGLQDRQLAQLTNMARYIAGAYKAPNASNPNPDNTYLARVYETQFVPGLKRMGFDVQDKFDADSVLPVARQILALGTEQAGSPAEIQSFEALTAGLSPDDRERARRIKLGLDDRASTPRPQLFTDAKGNAFWLTPPSPESAPPAVGPSPTPTPPPAPPALSISGDRPLGSVDGTSDTGGPTKVVIEGANAEQSAAIGRAVDALRAAGTPDDQIEAFVSAQGARFSQQPTPATAPPQQGNRPWTANTPDPYGGNRSTPTPGVIPIPGVQGAPKSGPTFAPLTSDEIEQLGLPPGTVAQRNLETQQVTVLSKPDARTGASGQPPLSAGEAQKVRRDFKETKDALNTFKAFDSALKDIPSSPELILDGDAKGRLGTAYNNARAALRIVYNTGVLQPGELPMLESALRDPTSFSAILDPRTRPQIQAQLDELYRAIATSIDNQVTSYPQIFDPAIYEQRRAAGPTAPSAPQAEVPRATNPRTGEVVEFRNGQWGPAR